MSPAASVYLGLAIEADTTDRFGDLAAEARRRGATHTDVRRAYREFHLRHAYRQPVGVSR